MTGRNDVPPRPLDVELAPEGIYVIYDNKRRVFYNGVPELVGERVRCTPMKDVQVLVTDDDGTEGVLTYVNELKTDDDILEASGVGRVMLDKGESVEVFPGVSAALDGYAVEVSIEPTVVDGRVFVFEEDERDEAMYELREEEPVEE